MTTMKQALEMAQKLNVEILTDDNGAYKFSPTIYPGRETTIYIHASNAAIHDRKNGLEWRLSRHYDKQQYQVRESSISIHTFPTIPALYTWLENETSEKAAREAQEATEKAAQARADKEGVTVYAIRAGQMFFVCTYEEIARDHAEDSIQVLHTANPASKPTGEEIAADAMPGDTIVSLNYNGQLRESTFKRHEPGRGVIAELDGLEIGIRIDKIRGLKKAAPEPQWTAEELSKQEEAQHFFRALTREEKAGSTPDPTSEQTEEEEETPEVTGCCYCGESVETLEAIQVGINMYWCGCDEKKPDDDESSNGPEETTVYPSENAYSVAQRRDQFREALAEDQEITDTRLNAPATILDSDIFPPDEESPITSEDDPFSFSDEEIQEATKDLPRQKINKNQLKREACALMANWLQSCLEAGNTATYQDQNGLSDEETQFLTDYIRQEIGKLDLRGTPPSERNNPPDDERDFPLYLEYQNLY